MTSPSSTIGDSGFVSRETLECLRIHADLVRKWQRSINLISPSTLESLWERHISDSVQLSRLAVKPRVWVDLGSGAGFPGLVTAIILKEHGDGWVHLVESNHKKAAFLRTAILETGARASVHPVRANVAASEIEHADAISARALAPLDDLLRMSHPWAERNPQIQYWFHKGLDYRREVESARGQWAFDLLENESELLDGSVVLKIENPRKRDMRA